MLVFNFEQSGQIFMAMEIFIRFKENI